MTPKLVLLAGGKGKRMGGDKPFAPYGQSTLIETTLARLRPQVREIVINAGAKTSPLVLPLSCLDAGLIFDDPAFEGLGPLSGVLSALEMARAAGDAMVITAPCDMPDLPDDMVARLLAAPPADVVYFKGARDYPLCALWRISVADPLRNALQQVEGGLAVMRFLATQNVRTIAVDDDAAFANINYPPLAPG
ncbi:molybdenum cofactor guanylyltransferase [Asticcacaulis sp.]|uniref:molybdenum cofactor guanylyltransferase n=1 Tax=Asticcacaulis sp. TaxID=1872648 RepID=UPI002BAA1CE5|nr:molybdenum cofactor guanylyltransferase [Asticcacaulis sp.]HTM81138.1 molybdenum cofactor guanylyltransferase [Asticcacaulis sp.]